MTKRTLYIAVIPILFIMGCVISFLLLPVFFDRLFLPKISQNLPFPAAKISLSKISPWLIRGTLDLSDQAKSGIVVPKFEIHFDPQDLLQKKISQLIIEAPIIHIEREGDKFALRGLQVKKSEDEKKAAVSLPALPFAIQKITIKNGLLVYHEDELIRHNLNFEATLLPRYTQNSNDQVIIESVGATIATHGILPGTTQINIHSNAEGLVSTFTTQLPQIEAVTANIPQLRRMTFGGEATLSGSIATDGIDVLKGFTSEISIAKFSMSGSEAGMSSPSDNQPLIINVEGNRERVRFDLLNLALQKPLESTLDFAGSYDVKNGSFTAKIKALPEQTSSLIIAEINGIRGDDQVTLSYQLRADPFKIGKNFSIDGGSGAGKIEYSEKRIAGTFSGKIPHIEDSVNGVVLKDINLDLPFNYPVLAPGVVVPGNLVVKEIGYKGTTRGKLRAAIEVSHDKAVINSLLTTTVNSAFQLTCNGTAIEYKDIHINCYLPEFEIDTATISPFVVLPEGLEVSGNVTAETRLQMVGRSLSGDAAVSIGGGSVVFDDFAFSEIDMKLSIPDLPTIQSKPSQLATIGSLELGNIKMSDAKIRFRLDDKETLFVEGIRLNWCGGRVETGGLRLYKNMEALDTTLYCDRLGYTELLNQLGIGDAEGEGSLNGRLPLYIDKGGIRFDDGFLFSTPGDSGIVRFRNTEQLRQGMPSIDRAAYLDYSLKALENFSYNWTKLTFNTRDKQLVLALQLDGKPAEPLPYGYKQGQIVKTETGRGLQHPIRLDVNFRLPLNDLFHYGKNIQSIMENM